VTGYRKSLQRILWTVLLAACLASAAALPGPVAAAGAPPTPVVVFQVESQTGRQAAERCAEIWAQEGPRLAAALLPADVSTDTIVCAVLGSASFQHHFAHRLPDWGVAVALPTGRLIALDYSRIPAVGRGLREIFLHETVHALLFQGSGGVRLPAWFHEGTAMHYSGEWKFTDTVSLLLEGGVIDLQRLEGGFPLSGPQADRAYRTSLLAVDRLRQRFGDQILGSLVRQTARQGSFGAAFAATTGETEAVFAQDFRAAMSLRFGWVVFLTRWPGLFVLLGLILIVGALRKILVTRRRLATMDDEDPPGAGTLS
jgi:hypothetical protein